MQEFPRTLIDDLSVSRMIIGTNWFMGYSHTSQSKDSFIRETMDAKRIASVLSVFMEAGIDTTLGMMTEQHMLDAVKMAEDKAGRKLIKLGTPHFDISDAPDALDNTKRLLDQQAESGMSVCMPHQCTTDALVDKRTRTIVDMPMYCRLIRERGMIPGLSTHLPEAIVYADEQKLDVATYIQIYNAAGFMMPVEVDWVHRIITGAAHPVLTIKPLAAGRLLPLVGLAFSWSTIRDFDMVAIGTMTPDEAKEVIELSWSLLEKRASNVQLQRTRSKASVTPLMA